MCLGRHENRIMKAFDGAVERLPLRVNGQRTRVQLIRAFTPQAFWQNLRSWANKSSPGGNRIPDTGKIRPTIGEMADGIARTAVMLGAATDKAGRPWREPALKPGKVPSGFQSVTVSAHPQEPLA
jgi:hypothetical protein